MELLVMFAALIALGLLAQRYGYDSHDRLRSVEERLAAAGFRSADGSAPIQPERGPAATPGRLEQWGEPAAWAESH